jgi:hypothetical protein
MFHGASRRIAIVCMVALLAGCGASKSAGTGAEETARTYFDALTRNDWSGAYELLHSDSTKEVNAARFTQSAQQYVRDLGFTPETVYVRSCDEHNAEAVAHVVLMGSGEAKSSFKDAVVLRRTDSGWRVVLSPRFGHSNRR